MMRDIGVKHVRSLINPTRNTSGDMLPGRPFQFARDLYANYGIKTMPLMRPEPPKMPDTMTDLQVYVNTVVKPAIVDHLDWLRVCSSLIGNAIDTLENFNEIDRPANNPDPAVFVPESKQGLLYTWNQSADLRSAHPDLRLTHMSLVGFKMDTDAPLIQKDANGNDIANIIHQGLVHHYPVNRMPETDLPAGSPETARFYPAATPTLDSTTLKQKLYYCSWYLTRGRWSIDMTEFNCDRDPSATPPKITSEATRSVYVPRMMLEAFRIGIRRTYLYLLLEDNTGRDDLALYKGPTFTSSLTVVELKKLTTILADSAGSYTTTFLGYSLSGETANLKNILFQKSNGEYWLALWLAVDIVDPDGNDLPAKTARQNVTVTFTAGPRTAQFYRDLSTTPTTAASTASAFIFSVGAKVCFVKIT